MRMLLEPNLQNCLIHLEMTSGENKWLKSYKELTQQMYGLRRACRSLPLLATSTVNPRHPVASDHLYLIDRLKETEDGGPSRSSLNPSSTWGRRFFSSIRRQLSRVKLVLTLLLFALRETFVIAFLRLRFGSIIRKMQALPATIVMRTMCVDPGFADSGEDYIYGRLPQILQERGFNCMLLCEGKREDTAQFARAVISRVYIRSLPEIMLVPFWAPLVTAVQQMMTSLALCRFFRKSADGNAAMLRAAAARACCSTDTMRDTLSFYAARAAVKVWHPKVFVTQYEGAPLEKLAWHGVKAANKNCVTVGYQHTVIMPHSSELTCPNRGSWEVAAPDAVLCLGEVTRDMMKSGHEPLKTKLILYGSFRRALNRSLQCTPKSEPHTVLVVPESRESKFLFDFAMKAAPILPGYHFILRCHPARPFDEVRPHLERDPEEFPNVEISDRLSLVDDCGRSFAVLYHSSSAVLVALLCGLKPLYLHDDGQYESDPLFELTHWRECVSSVGEMEETLRRYERTTKDCASTAWKKAADYVNAYAMPVDNSSIDRFLVAVGLSGDTPSITKSGHQTMSCETLS